MGTVVDLSTGGARVMCEKAAKLAPGDPLQLTVSTESQCVRVQARVAWVHRPLMGKAEVGLQFVGVRPGVQAALYQLGKFGCISADRAPGTEPEPDRHGEQQGVRATMEIEDLYVAFGLTPEATDDEIREAYRRLAREMHPDRCKEEGAPERFAHLAKAYSVLRDPEKRKRYDDLLARSRAA